MKKHSRLIGLLALCSFVPYSVFPLLYAVEGPFLRDQSESLLNEMAQNAADSMQVASAPDASEQNASPTSRRVLLRKKRALSVSSKDLLGKPPVRSSSPGREFYDEASYLAEVVPLHGSHGSCGHRSSFSGTAPPAPGGAL